MFPSLAKAGQGHKKKNYFLFVNEDDLRVFYHFTDLRSREFL